MKQLLLIALVLTSIGVNAQYKKQPNLLLTPEIIVPEITILTVFTINQVRMNNEIGTPKHTAQIAATGAIITVGSYLLFKHIRTKSVKDKSIQLTYR